MLYLVFQYLLRLRLCPRLRLRLRLRPRLLGLALRAGLSKNSKLDLDSAAKREVPLSIN